MEVLVFGATGNIGRKIVRALAAHPDVKVRIGSRSPEQARSAFAELQQVEPVLLDWSAPQTLDAALSGAARLVIVNPLSPDMPEQTAALIAAAQRAGVQQVLRTSVLGAGEPEPIEEARWHHAADEVVRNSGLPWVILKPNQYFQNFVNSGTDHTVRSQGAIYLPYADSLVSNIDTRDIGEIAARILRDEPTAHAGREYVLTGASAHSMSELASAISAALGKPVSYVPIPEEPVRQGLTQAGIPPVIVESILGWFGFCRAGRAARVDPSAATLLGRPPRGVHDFVRDYAHRYRA
jgi:uncharacterized protein YbjT (DUF2867 family)